MAVCTSVCNIGILAIILQLLSIVAVNLTLNTLIKDSDSFRKLLSDMFAFTPDLFESLLSAELTISPLELVKVNTTTGLQHLICNAK